MSEHELRQMVREVLREALAARGGAPGGAAGTSKANGGRPVAPTKQRAAANGTPAPAAAPKVEAVRLDSDADLAGFVRRLAGLMADTGAAQAIRDGRHRFTLARGPAAAPAPAPTPAAATRLAGTITEAKISKLPQGAAVALAPGAVITPLARDRARAMGIRIERRR